MHIRMQLFNILLEIKETLIFLVQFFLFQHQIFLNLIQITIKFAAQKSE